VATAAVTNTSTWVDGCPVGPSGLLASMGVACDSMEVCGRFIWGICVARILASVVAVRTRPPASWDGSSAGSSLPGLFFGWHFIGVLSSSQMVDANVGTH
jgi:hypothetical protein